jgi:hypothetical protein
MRGDGWRPLLAQRRPGRWLAPDLPGHGGSRRYLAIPSTLSPPDIPADALSPILADQIVARNIPAAAVKIIGIAAPTAVAGTTPIRTMPNATAPTMKLGNPTSGLVGQRSLGGYLRYGEKPDGPFGT